MRPTAPPTTVGSFVRGHCELHPEVAGISVASVGSSGLRLAALPGRGGLLTGTELHLRLTAPLAPRDASGGDPPP
jgi:hypothetical protein